MAEVAKAKIVSQNIIKPSSPTPSHLHHFNLSFLDQLAPPFYVPILLFYSPTPHDNDFTKLSHNLKASLSKTLTLYYPFCGRLKGNRSHAYVDCNDEGILYVEARIPLTLSDFLQINTHNPQPNQIKEFLPLDPYNPKPENHEEHPFILQVQVTELSCTSVGIGVCVSHRVCDGATIASFLKAWSAMAYGNDVSYLSHPNMDAPLLFPARDIEMNTTKGMTGEKNISTARFLFRGKGLSELRDKIALGCGGCYSNKPTRVEAVTALIWKCAIELAGGGGHHQSMVSHAVNIRSRMAPPLPENSIGNLWQQAVSPLVGREVELQDLAEVVRKTIKRVDEEYVRNIGEGGGFEGIVKSLKEVMFLVREKGVPCYSFSSWTRFDFYEANFGWGKPTWVCTIGVPIKNVIILMPTRHGDGSIEAWITLDELHMPLFQRSSQLLQFASFDL